MTKRGNRRAAARTSLSLLAAFVLSCVLSNSDRAHAFPQPEPQSSGVFYGDSDDAENIMLMNRLKQLMEQKHRLTEEEHEITDEQIEIQAILEAKARDQERTMSESVEEPEPEALPEPAAITHIHPPQSAKRQGGVKTISYMSLCHFKICNMGRKRQSI